MGFSAEQLGACVEPSPNIPCRGAARLAQDGSLLARVGRARAATLGLPRSSSTAAGAQAVRFGIPARKAAEDFAGIGPISANVKISVLARLLGAGLSTSCAVGWSTRLTAKTCTPSRNNHRPSRHP